MHGARLTGRRVYGLNKQVKSMFARRLTNKNRSAILPYSKNLYAIF